LKTKHIVSLLFAWILFSPFNHLIGGEKPKVLVLVNKNAIHFPYAFKRMLHYNHLEKNFAKSVIVQILKNGIEFHEQSDSIKISSYPFFYHLRDSIKNYHSRNTDLLKEIEQSKGWKRNTLIHKIYPKHFVYRKVTDQKFASYIQQIQVKDSFEKIVAINAVEFRNFGKQKKRMTAFIHFEYFDKSLFSYHAKTYTVEFPFKSKMYFNVFEYNFKKQINNVLKTIKT